ncbi:hypothetical protein FRC10_002104 [Ceratobasidium sp. 414]|nr:hypothetical protein FRC10_002104 [Ceratobasidium sp. 414]
MPQKRQNWQREEPEPRLERVEEILTALRITNLANKIRDFRENPGRQTPAWTPAVEPATQTQGAVLTEDEDRESTTKPEGLRRAKPPTQGDAGEEEEPYLNQTTTAGATIPKEARTKKLEPFSGKKGKEGEAFLIRMEVHFQDYEDGTFNNNWKIRATLMNMSVGDTMNWAQLLLQLSAAQESHKFLESWVSFKKGFLTYFSDPTKKEKAVRELSKLTQTASAQNYTVTFRTLAQEVDWNEQALKDRYMEGLKPQVKTKLMRLQIFREPENIMLEQWIALMCKADDMIYANSKMNSGKGPAHPPSKNGGSTTSKTYYKGKESTTTTKVTLVPNEEKD